MNMFEKMLMKTYETFTANVYDYGIEKDGTRIIIEESISLVPFLYDFYHERNGGIRNIEKTANGKVRVYYEYPDEEEVD